MSKDDVEAPFLEALKPSTRRAYRHAFAIFQAEFGSLRDWLVKAQEDMQRSSLDKKWVVRSTIQQLTEKLTGMGYAPNTVRQVTAALKSLLEFYGIHTSFRHMNLPPPTPIHKKHPWTIEEIGRFVELLPNSLYKSIAASIVQSGLGLSDLLLLTYGDIRDEYERGITPLCLDLTRKKTTVPFMTFLGEWAVSHLREYLADRLLIDSVRLYPVSGRAVERVFSRTGRIFGGRFQGRNPFSPHSLRAAFNTLLRDRKVDHIYIEYWMGHAIPEQHRAYVTKSREGWRETYRTLAEPWLTPKQHGERT